MHISSFLGLVSRTQVIKRTHPTGRLRDHLIVIRQRNTPSKGTETESNRVVAKSEQSSGSKVICKSTGSGHNLPESVVRLDLDLEIWSM